MTQVNAERQRGEARQTDRRAHLQFADNDEHRESHHKNVDPGEKPHDLEVGVIARKILLGQHVTERSDQVAAQKHRNGNGQRTLPAPLRRVLRQVIGQDQVTDEPGHVIESSVTVPVANTENPHIAVIAGIPQRRSDHFYIGQQQGNAPYVQNEPDIPSGSLLQPCADHGHDQIKADQHVEIPQRGRIVIEIKNKGIDPGQSSSQGMVVGDDHRITGRNDVIQVNEIRQRQHDRPENQRNDDASDTLPVKIPELRAYGKQQHPRHHHEQRDAGPDETTGEYPGQKCSPVGIEPGDERVAAVRQNHQKTGDDTQQVDPADMFPPLHFHQQTNI